MAAHLSEEEQIEAIKRWWNDNGKTTVALILAAVIGWFGWSTWQDRQERLAQQVSSQYAELMAVVSTDPGAALTKEQRATAQLLAEEIIETRPDSLYGNFSSLLLADLAMDAEEFDQAESHLRTAMNNAANSGIAKLANLRLARLIAARGDHDRALALLEVEPSDKFNSAYQEVRGDIYLSLGQLESAQAAYEQALAALSENQASRAGLIELKLNNSRVADSEELDNADETGPTKPAEPAVEGDT